MTTSAQVCFLFQDKEKLRRSSLIQETLALETLEISMKTRKLHYGCDVEDLCKFGGV
jgi:hypothetical protein